ncbi:MAG: hypothetical protein QM736_16935 [Vicinamibacterales bacterium]
MSADDREETVRSSNHSLATQWIELAKRRWQLVAGVWVATMILGVAVLWMLPREYESSARFLVKNARQDSSSVRRTAVL